MKRSNDVYFITLIDLLVQALFLGLLLYVLAKHGKSAERAKERLEQQRLEVAMKAAGVSNITELTDELTKLAPIRELKGTADFISRAGSVDELKKLAAMAVEAGGTEKLVEKLSQAQQATTVMTAAGGAEEVKRLAALVVEAGGSQRITDELRQARQAKEAIAAAGGIEKLASVIKKMEEGSGKPPCLFTENAGRKVAKPLATVIADDAGISFQGTNPELESMLTLLGKSYANVERLTLREFSATFAPLLKLKPDCRYTLRFVERTDLVHARDAARNAFYLNISK